MSDAEWIDDVRNALDRLDDAVALIDRAGDEPREWPFESWSDLMGPRAWTLQVARAQISLARFYLGIASHDPSFA